MGRELDSIDLTAAQRRTILALLKRHLPDTEVWAYGSRVKFSGKPSSDLDMVVFSKPEQDLQVGDLQFAIEESMLPFRVDVFVWDQVPESFKKNIEAERVVLSRKMSDAVPEGWKKIKLSEVAEIYSGMENRFGTNKLRNNHLLGRSPKMWESTKEFFDGEAIVIQGRGKELMPRFFSGNFELDKRSCRITAKDTRVCLTRFLHYALTANWGYWESMPEYATVKSLRMSTLSDFPLLLPPLREQHSIVQILRSLDDKIQLNHRMNKTLEDMMRGLSKKSNAGFEPVKNKMVLSEADETTEQADLAPTSAVAGKYKTVLKKARKNTWRSNKGQVKIVSELRINYLAETENLTCLRDSLLPKLVSGAIRVPYTKASSKN